MDIRDVRSSWRIILDRHEIIYLFDGQNGIFKQRITVTIPEGERGYFEMIRDSSRELVNTFRHTRNMFDGVPPGVNIDER